MTKREARIEALRIAGLGAEQMLASGGPFEGMSDEDAPKVEAALREIADRLLNRADDLVKRTRASRGRPRYGL